ncbi:CDP-glucose 4,6-dehydratase [candidate division WS5 bacterium]|uniref:CDP-glucose 4,6-dehydratase n=1 Tax=candidate division WS5 bacterium TaxID=2093353 RepID=A0A419DF99_9BACT|nr:MAG: CDP-glucose 4,6-dehydratase [candidate division WS5 bacterium]
MESVVVNKLFWKDKKVLITGHSGFKGSWLSLWLSECGSRVTGLALPPSTIPSLFEDVNVSSEITSIYGDVRDLALIKSVMNEFKPEIVFHLAAQALVKYSYNNPVETYSSNVMGTVNIMEAVRCSDSVRVLVNITSDKCYENREWAWGYREIEPMGGYDPYSSSKGCAELVTAAYRNSYFSNYNNGSRSIAVATARAGNVIGGGDWSEDRLVPDIMRAFIEKRPVIIRNPDAIRPWQHVLEPLSGYLLLAEKLWVDAPRFAEAWNFGPADNDAKPVLWIVENLVRAWGDGASWQNDKTAQPHEARYLKLDCSKAVQQLGWLPRLDLASALQWTTDFYKLYKQNGNIRMLISDQIFKYDGMKSQ